MPGQAGELACTIRHQMPDIYKVPTILNKKQKKSITRWGNYTSTRIRWLAKHHHSVRSPRSDAPVAAFAAAHCASVPYSKAEQEPSTASMSKKAICLHKQSPGPTRGNSESMTPTVSPGESGPVCPRKKKEQILENLATVCG